MDIKPPTNLAEHLGSVGALLDYMFYMVWLFIAILWRKLTTLTNKCDELEKEHYHNALSKEDFARFREDYLRQRSEDRDAMDNRFNRLEKLVLSKKDKG